MARSRKPTPSYLLHAQSGRARAVWTDATGTRHYRMLPGPFDSPESRTAFARLQLELETAPHHTGLADPGGFTVNELLAAYKGFAEGHYRAPDGLPTAEAEHMKVVSRYVRGLYGDTPAAAFGPLALKAVRQRFVNAGWCRKTVNQQTERVRRIFKWAASEELVPAGVYHALATVTGLQRGRTPAREPEPVGPVENAVVDATLPFLSRHVRGLVEFQRLTGCRPGEACRVRRRDIDTGGAVWLYRPPHHKSAWRGKTRIIAIGPKTQILLREFFTPDLDDYLFSPRRAVEELRARRSADRKTPLYPSHMKRNAAKRKAKPRRTPDERYDQRSYFTALSRACDKAFPPPGDLAPRPCESRAKWSARLTADQRAAVKAWRKTHRWHPNQLRHTFATQVRKEHGLEAAQVLLGHSKADVTQIYAEKNEALAVGIAARIG
jgi:integrase